MANLVIALDYTDAVDALNMAAQLQGKAPWMKVGLELFTREGP
ncbi:MAG: orotidine 5'-phosphate decarboxylase, partial [Deltaproteobacteria bacterium]|nr:orotidine 5'-phosphate decarboxylase [Deltaproteobacteria bacterium]